jgi:hypothetical protein
VTTDFGLLAPGAHRVAELTDDGTDPTSYLGVTGTLIDHALGRLANRKGNRA